MDPDAARGHTMDADAGLRDASDPDRATGRRSLERIGRIAAPIRLRLGNAEDANPLCRLAAHTGARPKRDAEHASRLRNRWKHERDTTDVEMANGPAKSEASTASKYDERSK